MNHKKLLFSWNLYHGECLVLLDFLQFSCFDDGSLGPGCTSTVISCCVYNLLLALDFLLRSLSLQGLWDGCQPMLTVSWSEIVHPVMERSRSNYASAVLFLYLCLQFCLCSSWMSKLQGSFSPCLFQPRVRSCTQHSLWIFSFAPCLEEAVSVRGETFSAIDRIYTRGRLRRLRRLRRLV